MHARTTILPNPMVTTLLFWLICAASPESRPAGAPALACVGLPPAIPVLSARHPHSHPLKAILVLSSTESFSESEEDTSDGEVDVVVVMPTSSFLLLRNGLAVHPQHLDWIFRPLSRSPLLRC